jgi:hypothetical protein
METDGGGWTLVLSYNVAGGTNPDVHIRQLADGFPLLSANPLGTDESNSKGPGGSWGHMSPHALETVPNIAEVQLLYEVGSPLSLNRESDRQVTHLKSIDPSTLRYLTTLDFELGVDMNYVRASFTPLGKHNWFLPVDGAGPFVADRLWPVAQYGMPVRIQLYVRGNQANRARGRMSTAATSYFAIFFD